MAQAHTQELHLTTPLSAEALKGLRAGDVIYLTGPVFTARDGVYKHMLVEGHEPPIDLRALTNVSFQSAPAGVEVSPGVYEVSSFQATAGFRYAQYMPALLGRYGVKAVVGKAGMSEELYRDVFKKQGAVCLSTMGYGLGASACVTSSGWRSWGSLRHSGYWTSRTWVPCSWRAIPRATATSPR